MAGHDKDNVDWDELKARLENEIRKFAGPDLQPAVPGMCDERPGWWEWNWYRSRPEAQRNPPGLTSADFAQAYRDDVPISKRPVAAMNAGRAADRDRDGGD